MLVSLSVQNYALIKHLEIGFKPGFSIITGETGAGKSILVGALSLLLGQRADTSVLKNKNQKCIVEGVFDIKDLDLRSFYKSLDIDYDHNTIVRREIIPEGKSRAFINDTPVNLNQLRDLGLKLVDIHSQHENLNLGNHLFQLMIIDTVAHNRNLLDQYRELYSNYLSKQDELAELTERATQARADLDYYSFQHQQLEEAKLQQGELEEIESEANTLNHAEEIKFNLLKVADLITGDGTSALGLMKDAIDALDKLTGFFPLSKELRDRIESVYIELKDISGETEIQGEKVEIDPGRLQFIQERIDQLYSLMHKHDLQSVDELIKLKEELSQKISTITSYDDMIGKLTAQVEEQRQKLNDIASKLSDKRLGIIPGLEAKVIDLLKQVGIPNARFSVVHKKLDDFTFQGKDHVEFLFSANKKAELQEISKVASGGELSRLMLSIKSLVSDSLDLPTIIFDEVDAGVSGEIAEKVGMIMKSMSAGLQVINITHLPQVTARGDYHYLVYKYDQDEATVTDIKLLNDEERIIELAKMLSGEEVTDAAISHAKQLLN
jgi:DNA repair protein RecN (Recombination protein N)